MLRTLLYPFYFLYAMLCIALMFAGATFIKVAAGLMGEGWVEVHYDSDGGMEKVY